MKILQLHNRYQQLGGEDAVASAERHLLAGYGHDVHFHYVDNHAIQGPLAQIAAATGAIYSWRARHEVAALLAEFTPDVVHVHNFFPLLSPSVYDACRAKKVPVVQTLHNYRLACPSAQLYREGAPCEDCIGMALPWPGVAAGCYRGSKVQTSAVAAMLAVHRARRTWHTRVDAFVALTAFQKSILVRAGLPADKVHIKPNFVSGPEIPLTKGKGSYALFIGRLSSEKGLSTLIEAYQAHGVSVPLKIVGDGPLTSILATQLAATGLDDRITLLGHQSSETIGRLLTDARFLVLPSTWYEGLPMVVLEAFSHGVPVLASAIGGLPEVVHHGENGWLAPPGRANLWAEALNTAWNDPVEAVKRGIRARTDYETDYAPKPAYRQLMSLYENVRRKTLCPHTSKL